MTMKYTLHKPTERNKFIVTIVADSNDGDYVTTINTYPKEQFDKYVVSELIDMITNYGGHHELKNFLGEFVDVPFNGYDGNCHTLESVDIKYVDENGDTWNVILRR
jgi:hypothetical protein